MERTSIREDKSKDTSKGNKPKFSLREDLRLFRPSEWDILLILLLSVAQTYPVYRHLIGLMWKGAMSYVHGIVWMFSVMTVAIIGSYLLVCVAVPLVRTAFATLKSMKSRRSSE